MTVPKVGIHPEFPILDSLRAVGAIAVLTTHVAFNSGSYGSMPPWGGLMARMDVGVAIFFVLSGFLLTRPWFARRSQGLPDPSLRRYAHKRVLRIMPAYLVVAIAALALVPSNDKLGPIGWLRALFMVDIYVSDKLPFGLTQTWSLATEVSFYLVLPLLMWLMLGRTGAPRLRRIAMVLGGLALLNIAWLGYLSNLLPGSPTHVNEWLPAFLTWFGAGIGLAAIHALAQPGTRLRRGLDHLAHLPGVCWGLAGALLLIAATPLAGPMLLVPATSTEAIIKNLLYTGVATLVVISGLPRKSGGLYARIMADRLTRHLGHISYGIFLVHMPILHFVMWFRDYDLFRGHFFEIWILTFVLSVLCAELLYRFVEEPFMRWRPKGRKSEQTAATPPKTASTA